MTAGILGFIFKDWVNISEIVIHTPVFYLYNYPLQIKQQATGGFQAFIVHYRDDPDQQNLIDWIQEGWVLIFFNIFTLEKRNFNECIFILQLQCCGIEGPKDWDRNIYFNCSSAEVGSREACGVPFSCCKPQPNV